MHDSVLLATAYLPPIEYIKQCLRFNHIVIELYETFPKQTYRNRCAIATANGVLPLTIPVKKPSGNHTLTKDIEIDFTGRWNQIHWRALMSAYTHSPYFLYYSDQFESIYKDPPKLLTEFNSELLKVIFGLLKTEVDLGFTSGYSANPETITDLRQSIHPKHDRPYPGKPTSYAEYTQTFNNKYSFIPNLSIIDLLFNEGPEALNYLSDH
ncbi:MAG: WbqC family protein [Bacteroidota bacterium]|nr:WbqC family protein [Bacteroidota bacterium]